VVAYISRRLLIMIPVVIGVTFISFFMIHLVPGNPAVVIAGVGASGQDIKNIELQLGLNHPLWDQYLIYLLHIFQGNLGVSFSTSETVVQEIAQTLPVTVTLALCSTIFSVVVGMTFGIISAAHKGKLADFSTMGMSLFALSMPSFWLGLMLILMFSVNLKWLPAAGWNGLSSIILPSITLGAATIAIVARMTRASLLDTLHSDYIRTAQAKGLTWRVVFLRHALKNALIPTVTVIGLEFGTLLGGAVITEDVFAIPGVGRLMIGAISARDYPTIEGAVLVIGVLFVLINLFTDLLYAVIDPRIRYD